VPEKKSMTRLPVGVRSVVRTGLCTSPTVTIYQITLTITLNHIMCSHLQDPDETNDGPSVDDQPDLVDDLPQLV
jgi:hypothetical protein